MSTPTLDEIIAWDERLMSGAYKGDDRHNQLIQERLNSLRRLQRLELALRNAKLEFVIAAEEFDHRAASSKLSQYAKAAEAWIKSAAKMRSLAALSGREGDVV